MDFNFGPDAVDNDEDFSMEAQPDWSSFGPDALAPGETAVPNKSTIYNDTRTSNKGRPSRASERPRSRNTYHQAA